MYVFTVQQIHTLIMSLSFSGIKIKTINSLESWNGGVLVVVSGSVKMKDLSGWRNFVQTFLLAPQEKGYFVLNDVFHFVNEEGSELPQAPVGLQNNLDAQPTASYPLAEPPGIVTSGLYKMLNMPRFVFSNNLSFLFFVLIIENFKDGKSSLLSVIAPLWFSFLCMRGLMLPLHCTKGYLEPVSPLLVSTRNCGAPIFPPFSV